MSNLKAFMFGFAAAFVIYYITKKGKEGTSILDEIIDNPSDFVNKTKDYARDEVVRTAKEIIG